MLLGGTPIAEAVLAGAKSFPGPHGRLFLTVDADPNGVVVATAGSIAILRAGTSAWINTNGGTEWCLICVAPTPVVSGLRTFADIDFKVQTPVDLKALGDGTFTLGGLSFAYSLTSACDSMALNSSGLYIGNKNTGTPFQFTATQYAPNVLVKPRDAIGVGPSGIREMWVWVAFNSDESTSRSTSAPGGGAKLEIWKAGAFMSAKGAGFGPATAGAYWKRLMFTNALTSVRDSIPQLTVAVGEQAVFAFKSFGFNGIEVHVGSTVGGAWPSRGSLKFFARYQSLALDYGWTTQSAPNTILDWDEVFDYYFRLIPPTYATGPETFIRFTRLKIEAEVI